MTRDTTEELRTTIADFEARAAALTAELGPALVDGDASRAEAIETERETVRQRLAQTRAELAALERQQAERAAAEAERQRLAEAEMERRRLLDRASRLYAAWAIDFEHRARVLEAMKALEHARAEHQAAMAELRPNSLRAALEGAHVALDTSMMASVEFTTDPATLRQAATYYERLAAEVLRGENLEPVRQHDAAQRRARAEQDARDVAAYRYQQALEATTQEIARLERHRARCAEGRDRRGVAATDGELAALRQRLADLRAVELEKVGAS